MIGRTKIIIEYAEHDNNSYYELHFRRTYLFVQLYQYKLKTLSV